MPIALKGEVYVKEEATASDAARRFETTEKFLPYAFVRVKTKDMLFGDSSAQTVTVVADDYFILENVDISTLYFKNAAAGQNGVVSVFGILATYN